MPQHQKKWANQNPDWLASVICFPQFFTMNGKKTFCRSLLTTPYPNATIRTSLPPEGFPGCPNASTVMVWVSISQVRRKHSLHVPALVQNFASLRNMRILLFYCAQYRFPKEFFVAPPINVGQFATDSFGMTEFLTRKRYPEIAVCDPMKSKTENIYAIYDPMKSKTENNYAIYDLMKSKTENN